ncbi:MAG: hypothetical protein M1820_003743 [Bogoriella megaspora]|nr:MAG: hypothetical protein M1820_003743 [Bogoriella megaspora]
MAALALPQLSSPGFDLLDIHYLIARRSGAWSGIALYQQLQLWNSRFAEKVYRAEPWQGDALGTRRGRQAGEEIEHKIYLYHSVIRCALSVDTLIGSTRGVPASFQPPHFHQSYQPPRSRIAFPTLVYPPLLSIACIPVTGHIVQFSNLLDSHSTTSTSKGPTRTARSCTARTPQELVAKVSHNFARASGYDTHDPDEAFTSSRLQLQPQVQAYLRPIAPSRPSSSSGSASLHTIRRTPRFEDQRRPRPRSTSLDSASRQQQQQEQASARLAGNPPVPGERPRSTRPRSNSAYESREPHPALRISRRTASAILYALEEALRQPNQFTPDLLEENAQMSDLVGGGNGRAANAGSRAAGGPVPVERTQPEVRTPREIWNRRQQREAEKRKQELDAAATADEQRRAQLQEAEARRISNERRAQAAEQPQRSSGGARRTSGNPVEVPSSGYQQGGAASAGQGARPAASNSQAPPAAAAPSRQQQPSTATSRARTTSASQDAPRPAPSTRSGTQRATQGASQMRPTPTPGDQPSAPQTQAGAAADGAAPPQPRGTTSSFPHAFQRWEDLSSHWEGLTSYWVRRLEQNTEELRREPLAQQMSRQINDLTAAGANLFHAVVELQRLRASSERKFQRWFFETRAETERAAEEKAQLERQLREERKFREEGGGMMEEARQEKRTAERMVADMRRELQISKDEARRAWEELGRREQEERERTLSLREGQPTLVGGVQVVPMAAGMASRQSSMRERPGTSGGYASEAAGPSVASSQAGGEQAQYMYEGSQSPTDTDPFTESGQQQMQFSQQGYQQYPPGSSGAASGSTAQTVVPITAGPSTQQPPNTTTGDDPATAAAQAFYRHQQPAETYLHYQQQRPPAAPAAPPSGATAPPQPSVSRASSRSQPYEAGSYVPSIADTFSSEGDEGYEMDDHGNVLRDERGHPIPVRRGLRQGSLGESLEEDDEFDVGEEIERERELSQRYGSGYPGVASGARPPPAPSSGAATGGQGAGYAAGAGPQVDYSGTGYGSGWEGMQRHHHPTRLSDVLEEDERSRTSPSRASGTSRPY